MKATNHLKSYGVSPRLKPSGKIGLQGVGSLPDHLKGEVVTWAKNNRGAILQELDPDVKNVFTEKGVQAENTQIPHQKHWQNTRLITPAMVEVWRGRIWVLDHLTELEAAGWTRRQLFQAGRYKYPCGEWGAAWFWPGAGCTPTLEANGAIKWTWKNANGQAISQTMKRLNRNMVKTIEKPRKMGNDIKGKV